MESALPRNLAARLSEECGQRRGSRFISTRINRARALENQH